MADGCSGRLYAVSLGFYPRHGGEENATRDIGGNIHNPCAEIHDDATDALSTIYWHEVKFRVPTNTAGFALVVAEDSFDIAAFDLAPLGPEKFPGPPLPFTRCGQDGVNKTFASRSLRIQAVVCMRQDSLLGEYFGHTCWGDLQAHECAPMVCQRDRRRSRCWGGVGEGTGGGEASGLEHFA